MNKKFSKTFVMIVAVLTMSFYMGLTSFASDESVFNGGQTEEDFAAGNALHETLSVAVASKYSATIDSGVGLLEPLANGTTDSAQTTTNQSLTATDTQDTKLDLPDLSKVGIAVTDTYINIRKSANKTAAVTGKLYDGAFVSITGTDGEWVKVTSGKVTGYVLKSLLLTGDEVVSSYDKYIELMATVQTDKLNVRSDTKESADIVAQITKGNKFTVIKKGKSWLQINLNKDKKTGYIMSEYVTVDLDYAEAISIDDDKAMLKAEVASKLLDAASNDYTITNTGVVTTLTDAEMRLFVCLIFCESGGESYDGKLGVASVIVNRIHNKKFANTLEGVVYAKGQFGPVTDGSLKKRLSEYDAGKFTQKAHKDSINAAKAALQGYTIVGSRCYFNGYKAEINKGHKGLLRIGNHLFWEVF